MKKTLTLSKKPEKKKKLNRKCSKCIHHSNSLIITDNVVNFFGKKNKQAILQLPK